MIIVKPRIKIVATILAKNEEDIIGTNIEHHLRQGVWRFIVTDNNSSDRTREIAASYPEVEIIDEPGDDHNQSKWVTRMAQMACELNPDWIVHLDADELWCGLMKLSEAKSEVVGCERMYLHPPGDLDHYLDFDHIPIPQECKVAHRPDPTFVVTHGNHGIEGAASIEFTKNVWRHHYPIRSYNQWKRKSLGHEALMRRDAPCERWKMWYNLNQSGLLSQKYEDMTKCWQDMIENPQIEHFHKLMEFWATPDMIEFFKNNTNMIPKVGYWKSCAAKLS